MRGVGDAFHELGSVIDAIETGETAFDITSATPVSSDVLESGAAVEFGIEASLLSSDDVDPATDIAVESVTLTDDGDLQVELRAEVTDPTTEGEADRTTEDEAGQASEAGAELTPEDEADRASEDDGRVDLDDDETDAKSGDPPYHDPERLREVYEKYDTFPEMTRALDADVTAQTVRRHMIDHGIHEPSPSTGGGWAERLIEANPDEIPTVGERSKGEETNENGRETLLADGVDFPDHLTLREVKVTVRDEKTVAEASRRLRLDTERARRLLRDLNLLDALQGRADGRPNLSMDDIDRRVRSGAPID